MGEKEDVNIENIELELLLQAIFLQYGYDFREYSRAHVKRRVKHRVAQEGLRSISELQNEILHRPEVFDRLVRDLSINVTEMFRNPDFYKSVRKKVIPVLKTYPYLKIWHAGCATGEEVFSFAILLHEEGLLERTQIYATDFNPYVIEQARKGIFPIRYIKEYTANYQKAGGRESFSDYYHANDEWVIFNKNLSKNMIFAEHNLVTDGVFAEVNMIVCRNVLIYFNRELQNKVLHLLHESLVTGGFLALGTKESLMFSSDEKKYKVIDAKQKIFKKKYE
ncbi:protein-glutamate O-methyltransferase CheR [Candidatus Sulfidibacterium hydrothermale]|uniref:CheR family methyltransferase n=1 Tax=Candidatus Sulfidibacterium hydrothermale TaxID=2875962 RepID=UPI001F0B2305|nr:protein-glutamate O-methyltransferase CheR [Candidatus Sulfidibacterium hydrothermale]